MTGIGIRLKALFTGAPSKPRSSKSQSAKTYAVSATDRAAVIADAMAAYRNGRAQYRGVIEHTLASLKAKPPSALQDPEGLARLLALHRANIEVRKLVGHDLKRFLAGGPAAVAD